MAIDVSEIVAQFGDYYEKCDQNMDRLVRIARKPVEFEQVMTPITQESDIYKSSETETTEVLQGYQKAWTPKGSLKFKPIEYKLRKAKIDIEIEPHDISGSWAGFLEGKSDNDVRNWPIVRFAAEMEYAPQMLQDMELKAMFHGEYVAPTPGTPGAASEVMDGVNKLRKDFSASGRLGTIAVGAPPADPVLYVDYIKDFVKQISSQYRKSAYTLCMSADNELKYRDGFLEKYGVNFSVNATDNARVMNLPIKIKGFDAMEGSEAVFVTPPKNIKTIRKAISNAQNWRTETLKREVYMYAHFYKCIAIDIPEIFFTNDVELV